MAHKEIPALTDGGAATSGDVIHAFRSPNSRKVTLGNAAGKSTGTGGSDVATGNHTHTASVITNTPAGDIAATDVQAALNELDGDKLAKAGGTMTGAITLHADPSSNMHAATKQYVDNIIAAQDAMVFKGAIDASTNPNYPAADRGWTYRISVAGKIGGASGPNVEVGDLIMCVTDSTASGNHATVGANWVISQTNLDGAVIGPASATNNHLVQFDGTSGKLIKGGKAAPSGDVVGTSDTQTLSGKTLTNPTIDGTIIEDVYTITDAAGYVIDPNNGSVQRWTLTASRTPGAASGNWANGKSVTLFIADGTAYTIDWSTMGVVWKGGTAPTLATSGYSEINITMENSVLRGVHVGDFAS